jgi:serine/threonine-protein kinase
MIDRARQPYRTVLIDFGLVAKQKVNKSDEGLILGTPSYMPPEQAKPRGNFGAVNATSDIYSLGATFYFLMTGFAPFPGKDPREIIKRVCTEPPPDPTSLNPEIPRSIGAICMKCLAKAQRDRYPSAAALVKDLDKELSSAQRMLKAKGFMRRIFGSGSSERHQPPASD